MTMHALAVLQALGRPVLLLSDPADFLAVGLRIRGSIQRDDCKVYVIDLPIGSRLFPCIIPAEVRLPSGARLLVVPTADGPLALSLVMVDDAREAECVGARVLVGRGLRLAGEERR